jgi:hypothetical protein
MRRFLRRSRAAATLQISPTSAQPGAIWLNGNVTAAQFIGDGSLLTNLDAEKLTGDIDGSKLTGPVSASLLSGTIDPARLPPVSTAAAGALSPADKTKLDALSPGSYVTAVTGAGPSR